MTIRTNGQIIGGTSGGITEWGKVKGTLSDQTDLQDALDNKLSTTAITNCITEIPQDIKLELNNGTLTLAQGCKGYMGDGTVRTTTGTLTLKNTGSTQMFLHITSGGTGLFAGYMTGGTVSERPSSPITYASYYNTSTKKCEYYNGSTWTEISLPIAIVTRGADGFVSIDQVFNGFGYIGSTIFALPGVKGLIPNGRNADGSLKSIEYNRTTVRVDTFGIKTYTGLFNLYSFQSYNAFQAVRNYNEKTNTMVGAYAGSFISGEGYLTNGVITSFAPKTPFHAVDYNDFNSLSNAVIDSRHQVVSAKPSVPTASVFYYVRE